MPQGRKLIAENRKARHDFHILERVEAGVALQGTEVKSLRDGGGNLRDAFAQLRDGEVFLVGANIAPYRQGNSRTTSRYASASCSCTVARSASSARRSPSEG